MCLVTKVATWTLCPPFDCCNRGHAHYKRNGSFGYTMLLAQDASSQRIYGAPTRIYCLNLCCICIAYNSVMVCACCAHIPCIWRYSNKNTEFVMWCDVRRWHTVFAQICVMMVDPGQAQFNSRCHFRETSHRMIYVSRANAFCTERTRNAAIRSCPSQKPGATKKRFRGDICTYFLLYVLCSLTNPIRVSSA